MNGLRNLSPCTGLHEGASPVLYMDIHVSRQLPEPYAPCFSFRTPPVGSAERMYSNTTSECSTMTISHLTIQTIVKVCRAEEFVSFYR